jgi:hypothetical protein
MFREALDTDLDATVGLLQMVLASGGENPV